MVRLVLGAAALLLLLPGPAVAASPVSPSAKLDSHLLDLTALTARRSTPAIRVAGFVENAGPARTPGGRVLVDVAVRGDLDAAAAALESAGLDVRARSSLGPLPTVEGLVAPGDLVALAALASVRSVTGVWPGLPSAVISRGDVRHRGPAARAVSGVTGAGVTVGLISDSFNRLGGFDTDKAQGELPPGVTVLNDSTAGTDEGRAIAQVLYDTAPGITQMLFEPGFQRGSTPIGPLQRAQAMDNLVARGARIIADDTGDLLQPYFQDGEIAQAADRARAAGTLYVEAAGNLTGRNWEGTFTPTPSGANDFGDGSTEQLVATVPAGGTVFVAVHWANPFGNVTTELDAEFTNCSGGVVTRDFTNNIQTGRPVAALQTTASPVPGGPPTPICLRISRRNAGATPLIKTLVYTSFRGTLGSAYTNSTAGAIDPAAASARGALTVAAIPESSGGLADPATGPLTPEAFSSRGPVTRLYDKDSRPLATPEVRVKPDLAGADGVDTSVPGLAPFFGTSAAVPGVAGVAALVLSAKPSLTVDALRTILTDPANTLDCALPGLPDRDCGYGFPLADRALATIDSSLPTIAAVVNPAAPTGGGGYYTGDVSVSWTVADPDTPVTSSTGCGPRPVTADTPGAAFTCAAQSVGGAVSKTVTIKRDTTPPALPSFSGIAAGAAYPEQAVPAAGAVTCAASDATSGIAPGGCVVSGYSAVPGAHTLTATVSDVAGLTRTATLDYTVTPTATAAPARRSVTITRGAVKPLRFRPLAKPRAKTGGATLTFTLSAPASVAIGLERLTAGRTRGKVCVIRTRRNRRAKPCTRAKRLTTLRVPAAKAGVNRLKLTGLVARRRLPPGRYRAVLVATPAGGDVSAPLRVAFFVKR